MDHLSVEQEPPPGGGAGWVGSISDALLPVCRLGKVHDSYMALSEAGAAGNMNTENSGKSIN